MKSPPRIHALILVLLGVIAWIHQDFYDFEADDAFISYRYASNWASGHGPVFNVGERVEGYSNFLWVALLAVLDRSGLDVVEVSRQMGTLASLAVIALVYATLVGPLRRSRGMGLAGSAVIAFHAAIAVHALSGLETLPLTALVLAAERRFLVELRARKDHRWSGALMGAVALLRADGLVFGLPVLLLLLFRRRSWREIASFVIPLSLLVLPHVAWRVAYYGEVLPNTFYVRVGGGIFQEVRGLFYLYKFILPFGGLVFFALPLLLLTLRDPERDEARGFLGLCVVVTVLYIVWVGGDYLPMGRFLIPIVPAITILQLESLIELRWHIEASRLVTRLQAGRAMEVSIAMIALSGLVATLVPRRDPQAKVTATKALTTDWTLAGRWFHDHFDPSTTLAAEPVGALAYYSGLCIIDMLGTNDRHIAHVETAHFGRGTAGHEKRDFAYVLSRQPQLIFEHVTATTRSERDTTYENGSVYSLRCVGLGIGSHFDREGAAWRAPIYLWFSERRTGPRGARALDSADGHAVRLRHRAVPRARQRRYGRIRETT